MTTYEPVIGLEIHARIRTKTKLFCRCLNEAIPSGPNTNICPICTGFPGMLPALNEEAVRLGTLASLALGCTICPDTKFDRKNYFYPDLPMGYQISQYDKPLGSNGKLDIEVGDRAKTVFIERLHLENDAGKLSHSANGSLVDLNRSGAPLMEIVSGPDLFSIEEASSYAREMQNILRSVGASEADMEKGMMRFDANISLRPVGVSTLGTKVEIKNLNSFRSLEKALVFEIQRQTKMLENGETIKQETRGFDDAKEITVSQRSKEEAADYRYFPEPDIPPLNLTPEFIESLRNEIGELPLAKKRRYMEELNLDKDTARLLSSDRDLATYFETLMEKVGDAKSAASWTTSVLLGAMNESKQSLNELRFSAEDFAELISMVKNDKISNLNGKETFTIMYNTGQKPAAIVGERGFLQVSDTGALETIVKDIIAQFPAQAQEYRAGKVQLLGFFVGQAMKASKGSANPKVIGEIAQSLLNVS